jgi:hypothetical protein
MVLETSVSFIRLTRLIAREDFVEQTQIISIKVNGLFFCEKNSGYFIGGATPVSILEIFSLFSHFLQE